MLIQVEYDYLNAEQLAELKSRVADELFIDPQKATWGSYGPNKEHRSAKVRPMVELDTDHLENILITQPHVTPYDRAAILFILKTRYLAELNNSRPWPA